MESEVCSEVEVQTDGQQRQTGERVTGALLAAAAGRRGEPGERERERQVFKLAATRTPGNTGPLELHGGSRPLPMSMLPP